MISPRPYQEEALKAVLSRWRGGITRQLVSLPTGTGKTVIFGMVAEAVRVRTLVMAHREELLHQAREKIRMVWPEADVGILQAGERGGLVTDICVASVQTAVRHLPELAARGFRLLICDEAHHAVSPSYVKTFGELGFLDGVPGRLLLGVTATAYRGDKAGLGAVFEEIVFERSILAMMKAGYLCDVRGLEVKTGADLSNVHTRAGDFAVDELAGVLDTPERNALVAETYLRHGEGRRGVVFGVRVDHALHLAAEFRARRVPCEAVYGDMPADARREVLRRYETGELKVLTNCAVLTEGWDVPDTDIIMMARPTKSRGLYVQCVGRGLRLAPGKTDCLLVDFVDVARRHKLAGFGTLAGKEEVKAAKGRTLLEAVAEVEKQEARAKGRPITPEVEHLDLFERSRFVWQKVAGSFRLALDDGGALWCYAAQGGFIPLLAGPDGQETRLSDTALPLDYCMGTAEDQARRMRSARLADKNAPWRKDPASEAQLEWLRKLKVPFEPGISKGEASDLISMKKGEPATERQRWFIAKNGLHRNPALLTMAEAGRLIGQFKRRQVTA